MPRDVLPAYILVLRRGKQGESSWAREQVPSARKDARSTTHRSPNSRNCSTPGWRCPSISGGRRETGSFPPSRVFWLFPAQVPAPDRGCAEVLKGFLAWLALAEGRTASPNTGAYCRARTRLPLPDLEQVRVQTARRIEQTPAAHRRWCGRRVKVVDGSSLSMPDTAQNQARYPQPRGQKPGCGFPVMRVVAVFSLFSGAVLQVAQSALGVGERTLFRRLWDTFKQGEVALTDCGFCGFAEVCLLTQRAVDCVVRNHPCRKKGLTQIKRLGPGDRIVEWHKTKVRPNWFSQEQWQELPERLTVREVTFCVGIPGFRTQAVTLATTLLDPREFPAEALAELYALRWRAELYLRDIKITLGMDVLRCKTPDRVRKELCMHLTAYNLIRALMLQAAHVHRVCPLRLRFKGACAAVRSWAPIMAAPGLDASRRGALHNALLRTIARDRIPHRPNRTEPRAKKRRPKNYQLLTQPRHTFHEAPHREKYKKPRL